MAPVAEDELLIQRAVERGLLTKEQLGRCIAAQKKLLASGKNVSVAAIVRAAKFLSEQQFAELRKSLDKEEALPRLGGFEILGRIGKGGMGYVFKARQVSMDRVVALKILPANMARDKSFVERFRREAKAAARLSHTNIIQSIDVGEQDGHHYFAMEYVEGPTVDEILTKTGRVEENLAVDIIAQVARAIQAAEKLKIVHLDIKPSNIMITADRVAKLADFGLARRWTEGATAGRQAMVFGTPEYISPEQALGQTDLDSRSDIYSLGATFYQMLTGEPPFKGATPREIVDKRLTQYPPHPKQLNPALSDQVCQVLDKMLQRDRNYRYQNGTELIEDLEYIQRSRAAQAVWPIGIMQQAVYGVQQGDVLYDEVSSIIGPAALRRARGPSGPGLAAGVLALLALAGIVLAGVYIYFYQPELWGKIFPSGPPQRTSGAPRTVGQLTGQGQPSPVAPTPIARMPEAPTTPLMPESPPEAGKAEAEKCIAEATRLAAAGDYKGALAVLEKYPREWAGTVYGAPVKDKYREVKLAVEARYNQDMEEAKRLRRAGKLAESRAVFDKIKAYLLPSMIDEATEYQQEFAYLEAAEKKAQPGQEKASAEKMEKLRSEARAAAAPLLQSGKYDEAITKIQAFMADPGYASVRADLELELKDIMAAREFAAAIADGGKNLVGQPVSVKGMTGGTLKSFEGDELVVSLGSGKEFGPYKVAELRPKDLLTLAAGCPSFKGKAEGEQHLMCALYLLARNQPDPASEEFQAAKKAGIDVSRYPVKTAPPPSSEKTTPTKKPPGKK
jgi:serine/threonine-protein kinase